MPFDLPLNSRYLFIDAIRHKGQDMPAWWSGAEWLSSAPIRTIIATAGQAGRADLIAYQHLGSVDLWWIVLYYNNRYDINWPRAGDEVSIPDVNLVLGG